MEKQNRGQWHILIWMALAAAAGLQAGWPGAAAAQVSLVTVVELAQRNSSSVRLAEADVQKAEAALSITRDAFVPSLELGSGLPAAPAVGFTGGVPSIVTGSVQSMVLSFPQLQYIKSARAALEAASLSLKNSREQVALDASTAYIELDTVDQELEASREQETLSEKLVTIEQERAEAGVDPLSDLLQAKLTVAELRLKRLHLEVRAEELDKQLATLTGLPAGSIRPDRASIPEIPAVTVGGARGENFGIQSAEMMAVSKQRTARGEFMSRLVPELSFQALYLRNTTILNDFNAYYNPNKPIPTNNFSSGFSIQIPIFNLGHDAKARESAADALRARVEVEEVSRQSEVQIAALAGSLRELDAMAEIASLKRQISDEQLKAVLAQLETGNGAASGPGAPAQLSPKAEELARIDERQKFEDALDAGFNLAKARLSLLRALGHMGDWLAELHTK